ncbi:acyltransferase [Shewanella fodinae]|uniref:acyltransferase n=1 Tax=Shewanella fodinae TaxID=552357 RepID=UPI00167A4DA5|nr:acyltransferase [Shewanella fodinae]MCL2906290.1 acyltransferase [Shewanella fodinae]GGZ00507.1 galactoside O-acetyltransferase [Shewanella fodinae]
MAYYSEEEVLGLGLKYVGKNVKISKMACIYNTDQISLDDNSRIDDFCIISGSVTIGKYVHVTPMCLIAGGKPGVTLHDFATLAYGVKVFSQSDDYSGATMVNSLVPKQFKNEIFASVTIHRHCIVGTNSVIMPGVELAEGCSVGAMTLVNKSTAPWGIYLGTPARRVKERQKNLLELEQQFLRLPK